MVQCITNAIMQMLLLLLKNTSLMHLEEKCAYDRAFVGVQMSLKMGLMSNAYKVLFSNWYKFWFFSEGILFIQRVDFVFVNVLIFFFIFKDFFPTWEVFRFCNAQKVLPSLAKRKAFKKLLSNKNLNVD